MSRLFWLLTLLSINAFAINNVDIFCPNTITCAGTTANTCTISDSRFTLNTSVNFNTTVTTGIHNFYSAFAAIGMPDFAICVYSNANTNIQFETYYRSFMQDKETNPNNWQGFFCTTNNPNLCPVLGVNNSIVNSILSIANP